MIEQKTLSIVIPTYNRGEVIPYTLSLFHDQVVRNSDEVELVVCNNASTDCTAEVLCSLLEKEKWFTYINYDEHVNIDCSILRSIENVNGKFFWLFGDDDVPSPAIVETLLNSLKKYPQIGLLTFNSLIGESDSSLRLRNLNVKDVVYSHSELLYTESKLFTEKIILAQKLTPKETEL